MAYGLLLSIMFGVLLGLGAYTFHFAHGTSYFSNDPRACVNCHIMREQYDSWQKASHHAAATCNDCHAPQALVPKYLSKASNGYWHSRGFTFMDFKEPIRIKPVNAMVLQENCLRCHQALVTDVAGDGQHARDSVLCVRCHLTTGHGASN